MSNQKKKTVFTYLAIYFLLWLILFELILPVNKILPRPSIVIQSFPSLISDYNLLPNYLSTTAVVYLALAISYLIVRILGFFPSIHKKFWKDFFNSLEWFTKYLPVFTLGFFLLFWFPASEYIEFLFAFLACFIPMFLQSENGLEEVPDEYISSVKTLGFSDAYILRNIRWKFGQASVLRSMNEIHFSLWIMLIAFEFVKGGYGIGNVIQRAYLFTDISAFFSALILTGLTIFIGNACLNYIKTKIIFWM